MNFDTRHLIRWGIPGWVFTSALLCSLVLLEYIELNSFAKNGTQLLASTAILTVVGIPVGYILNQIHHVWNWVIRVDWNKYFIMEQKMELIILSDHAKSEQIRKRYRYLLYRVHELGGLLIAIFSVLVFTIIGSIIKNVWSVYLILFLVICTTVYVVVLISRNYYRSNLDALTKRHVKLEYKNVRKDYIKKMKELIFTPKK